MTDRQKIQLFDDVNIHVRFKLFALWSSVMFFYIYGDYFELYQPGKLRGMTAGPVSQGSLLGMAAVMAIPGPMPFLSLILPPMASRWMNIVFGAAYSAIMAVVIRGGWHFYIVYGAIETVLTLLITWYAWTWPKQPAAESSLQRNGRMG